MQNSLDPSIIWWLHHICVTMWCHCLPVGPHWLPHQKLLWGYQNTAWGCDSQFLWFQLWSCDFHVTSFFPAQMWYSWVQSGWWCALNRASTLRVQSAGQRQWAQQRANRRPEGVDGCESDGCGRVWGWETARYSADYPAQKRRTNIMFD